MANIGIGLNAEIPDGGKMPACRYTTITELADGTCMAHWLERGGGQGKGSLNKRCANAWIKQQITQENNRVHLRQRLQEKLLFRKIAKSLEPPKQETTNDDQRRPKTTKKKKSQKKKRKRKR
mgnify:CR=1 FL=1